MRIFLDDLRKIHDIYPNDVEDSWVVIRNPENFKDYVRMSLIYGDIISEMSFDHDLGICENGYDLIKWFCDFCIENNIKNLPEIHVHSANPVGRKNIESYVASFKKYINNKFICENCKGDFHYDEVRMFHGKYLCELCSGK